MITLQQQEQQHWHCDLLPAMQATTGKKQALVVEEFTMECLDAFLQTSLHVLWGVKNGSLGVMCAIA